MLYASTSICGQRVTWMGRTVWLRPVLPSRGALAANDGCIHGPKAA